mgnify:CR=1 FL=1
MIDAFGRLAAPGAAAASLDTCLNFHGRVPVCEGVVGLDSKRSAELAVKVVAAASLDTCLDFHGRVPVLGCFRDLFRPQQATNYKAVWQGKLTAGNQKTFDTSR